MDYNKTLSLPKTAFPMRANLPKREPEILKKWEEMNIYQRLREERKGKEKFVLHDGPPYANGRIHMGHALNKILKDIIIKYNSMKGKDTPFVPGWDCHGLPIEHQVVKNLKEEEKEPTKVRKLCREFAAKYVDIQREDFIRLGVFGDWFNPYLTMDKEYEAKILEVFENLYKEGYIYQGLRPIHWCPSCKTALAEAEVEYKEHTSPSIYVKFRVVEGLPDNLKDKEVYVLIWTTTPWTLPANLAIALNDQFEYAAYKHQKEYLIMAKRLAPVVGEAVSYTFTEHIDLSIQDLEKLKCKHPFIDRIVPIIFGEHVTLEAGTGCVHTAPGHGLEDFVVGKRYGLNVLSPVDESGRFTDEYPELKGEFVFDANKNIIEILKQNDALLHSEEITHSYPHCWRCKGPLIFRATKQWFLNVEHKNLKDRLLESIEKVEWIPKWGYDRIKGMLENRPDWCLSRQRFWGVPIPYFICKDCGETYISQESIEKVISIVKEKGIDAWFELDDSELLPEDAKCPACGSKNLKKGNDILDVWFDSGVSHFAVCEEREELTWPADMYLEGSDQHRGWFQTSLIPAVALKNSPPYKTVLTHGFLLDEKGEAMSKSKGNVISPNDIIKKYGADIIRLWVSSENYQEDLRLGYNILDQLADAYRKIRNTFRFLLGNLSDFKEEDLLPIEELHPFDRWVLHKLNELIENVDRFYKNMQFHRVYREIYNFSVIILSNLYFAINKDILYTYYYKSPRRRSVQTSLYYLLDALPKLLAPILSFTTEEVYSYIPKKEKKDSIHLELFPEKIAIREDKDLKDIEELLKIREIVYKALEEKRKIKEIGDSLEAKIYIYSEPHKSLLNEYKEFLPTFFIVSQVYIEKKENAFVEDEVFVLVQKADGEKCPRCWNYSTEIGKDPKYKDLCPKCVEAVKAYESEK